MQRTKPMSVLGPFIMCLVAFAPHHLFAQSAPKLVSLFPLGGQRGTSLDVEIQGSGLTGVYAVWLGAGSTLLSPKSAAAAQATVNAGRTANPPYSKGSDGIAAHVKAVPDGSRAQVRLAIAPNARPGFHTLGLISPGGLSGSTSFWVGPHTVIQETDISHNTPATAQPVKLPVAVNGRITASAELDYYAFDIAGAQTVAFEIVALHGANFDPQLALYETGGSFLDPQRSRRLLFHEEITQGGMPAKRRLTHHFNKPGRYVVNLANLLAQAGGDSSYLLRIAPVEERPDEESALAWARRRLQDLHSRAVAAPAMNPEFHREAERKDNADPARTFKVPAVLEGTIGRPGDIDRFRFKARAGEKLVFEIQTPHAAPPHFNPRLDVVDAKGAVRLSNLHVREAKIGEQASRVIQRTSEIIGSLDREGGHSLRIRDLTSIHGSSDHVYRVLVRPQIPHVGEIRLQPDGPVNLLPGGRQRLTLSIPSKEGYAGSVAVSVEGLPEGVRAFVGSNNSIIELVADLSVRATPMPQIVRIWGLPQVAGKSGSPFLAAALPIMVLKK
jgi:hypothetical protein